MITNPYFYSYSIEDALPSDVPVTADDVLESTIIIPIFNDGKYVGMTGMDIPLNTFQRIIERIRPFEGSYAFLVANNGSVVAHPVLKNIRGSITEVGAVFDEQHDILTHISKGRQSSFIDFDSTLGNMYVSIVPVKIGRTNTPWAMGIAIPVDLIEAEAMSNFYIAVVVGLLGLIILAFIIWVISGNITRPLVRTTGVLKKLARGNVDDSMVQEVMVHGQSTL